MAVSIRSQGPRTPSLPARASRRIVRAYGLFLVLTLSVASGHAETADAGDPLTRSAARDLAAQGAEAFDQQRYDAALDLFTRAGALVRAPTIVLMQARSLRQLGRWVEAIDTYEIAQRMPLPDDANATFRDATVSAAEEGRALWERLPRLNVRVEGTAKQTEVWVDGRKLPPALVGVETPFDPGPHRVEVRAPNLPSVTRDIVLSASAHETLVIPFDEPPPVNPAAAAASKPAATDPSAASGKTSVARTMSWVAVGTGTALLATGITAGVLALEKRSDLDAVCQPGCPPSYEDDIDRYRSYRTISYVSIGLGAAAVLAGAGYLVFSHKSDTSKVSLRLAPGALSLHSSF